MQQPERAAAQARAARLDHRERRAHRDRRIERVAALLQDFHPGLGCQRMRARDSRFRRLARVVGDDERRRPAQHDDQDASERRLRQGIHAGPESERWRNGGFDQAGRRFAQARFKAASTLGCTNWRTSPPKLAISRTRSRK